MPIPSCESGCYIGPYVEALHEARMAQKTAEEQFKLATEPEVIDKVAHNAADWEIETEERLRTLAQHTPCATCPYNNKEVLIKAIEPSIELPLPTTTL